MFTIVSFCLSLAVAIVFIVKANEVRKVTGYKIGIGLPITMIVIKLVAVLELFMIGMRR